MIYDILYYSDLNYTGLKEKFDKTINLLHAGDFKSAEVKKLKPSNYLRAKLDDSNRLLFTPIKHKEKTYLVILEVIRNHEYEKSRFLRGVSSVDESNIINQYPEDEQLLTDISPLQTVSENKAVHFLDKFIMFDNEQSEIITCPLPVILIGSAGSGKTSLMLEKLKTLAGNILYVSLSGYLVHNTRQLYYSHNYENENQEVDFLSFHELLETIKIHKGKEVTINNFLGWFNRQPKPKFLTDGRKIFEEFRGVITGSNADVAYLSAEDYLNLGIKQSIYLEHERKDVYQLFSKYLGFLQENKLYDSNIISHEYRGLIENKYDIVLVDEIQDFTNSQLSLVLKCLTQPDKFFLCGDANQIVHPNFFSWSKLKSYFYKIEELQSREITAILTKNYRNTPEVIELANRVLKLKNYKFGSIDKESHFLITSTSNSHGVVSCIDLTSGLVKELNSKTSKSIKYAVLVLHETDKIRAKAFLNTPLVFTPQEAKGLEYENVILFDFISSENKYFDIAKGVGADYLDTAFTYARTKQKTDKALEVYKFYVNSLYVVITRATKNIYLIESNPSHPFIQLLNINEIQQINIQEESSSLVDWAAEANKLAQQGKIEQMQAIETQILCYTKVPWDVLTIDKYVTLRKPVFIDIAQVNKKDQIKILNYAIVYSDNSTIDKLKDAGVKAAHNIEKATLILENEYFSEYTFKNPLIMLDKVKRYGINFRNTLNLTPLMCAAYMFNDGHIDELIKGGANLSDTDNYYRTAFQVLISRLYNSPRKILPNKIFNLYSKLCPTDMAIQINEKLIKIGANKIEFLLLNVLLIVVHLIRAIGRQKFVFTSETLLARLQVFSGSNIIIESRLNRTYISSVLSRNEVNSNYKYSRKLFMRISQGKYMLNPDSQIKVNESWIKLSDFSNDIYEVNNSPRTH